MSIMLKLLLQMKGLKLGGNILVYQTWNICFSSSLALAFMVDKIAFQDYSQILCIPRDNGIRKKKMDL